MKKFFFVAISLIVLAGSVSAQTYYHPRRRHVRERDNARNRDNYNDFYTPKVGVEAGVNISNTVDAYNSNYSTSTRVGWHAGLTFEIPLIYPLSFAPEVLYSQKGFSANTPDGHFDQRNDYIDVPLLAKFRLVPGFNFYIGPQLTFLTSTHNSFDNGFTQTQQNYYNQNYNDKSYVAGVVGVSLDINRYVDIRARYAIDLGRNYPDDNDGPAFRNQVWQFGLGIKFQ